MIKCKRCKKEFEPLRHNGIVASRFCMDCLLIKVREKKKKDWNKEKKERKEKLKSHSDWLNELQNVFNAYIRARDKGQPCISCMKAYGSFTKSAGHYFSVGAYPALRFNEDNCHLQCWFNCNKNKHGNITEYTPNLIRKIGIERFNALVDRKNEPLRLTTEEVKEKIEYYKKKIKEIKV